MRICLYTNTALPTIGGQEVVVDALARQFVSLGHHLVVLAPHPSHPRRLYDGEFPYAVVRHPRFYSMRRFVQWYRWWLLSLHRRQRFDVIHCHGLYPPGYLASLYRNELKVPIIITSHGEDVYEGYQRLAEPLLYRRHVAAIQGAQALVAISRFTRAGFERLCPGARRIVEIPNGVDAQGLAEPVPRPADLCPTVGEGDYALFLGRLERRKGVDVLLRAVAGLAPQRRVLLVIAGDGKERPPLESLAADLGLGGQMCFLGNVDGAKKSYLLQNARCVVIPSRDWEAFGLVVLESYAAGRPVIASRLPGLGDLVEPGRTGWLVSPESVAELAAALDAAFAGDVEGQAFRDRAMCIARQFAWREIAQRHLDLYEELCSGRCARAA